MIETSSTPRAHRPEAPAGIFAVRSDQDIAAFFHDVRAPLSALQMLVDALEDGVIDESTLPDHLQRLRLLAERVAALSEELLPRSNPPEPRPVAIRQLLLDAATVARPAATAAGVEVRVTDIDPSLNALVAPTAVARALDNIVENAVRHTPPDHFVTLSAEADEDLVCALVEDGCNGIPTAEIDLLFAPGYQGEKPGSAGIGLAIARDLVAAQNGHITVANEEFGCRFEIWMPRAS